MKHKTVSTIAALLCGTLLGFAVFSAAFAQTSASGDTFPKTPEEIKLVEDLIMSACSQYKRDYEDGIEKGYSAFQIYELMYNSYYLKKPLVKAADDWLKKAIAENYSEAFGEYARRYMLGEHARQDFRKAYHYYKLAYDYYDMSWGMKDSIGGFTAIPQLECCIKKRIFDCFGFLNR